MLDIANGLYQASAGGHPVQQPQPQYQQPQYQQPPPAPEPTLAPTQDDWLNDPAGASQRYVQHVKDTEFAPALQANQLANANNVRSILELKHPNEFARYGPEIEVMLRQVDPAALNTQIGETVIQMVRGNHVDELAEERAKQRVDELTSTGGLLRPDASQTPTTATPTGVDLDSAEFSANYRRLLKRHRIDEPVLNEFLSGDAGRAYGNTMEERRKGWMEMAAKGDIITEERFSSE